MDYEGGFEKWLMSGLMKMLQRVESAGFDILSYEPVGNPRLYEPEK